MDESTWTNTEQTSLTEEWTFLDETVTADYQNNNDQDLPAAATDFTQFGNSQGNSERCRLYGFSVSVCWMGSVVAIGLVGNILSLMVISRMRQTTNERNMSMLLNLLTVYDLLYLASLGLMTAVPTACSYYSECPSFFEYYPYLLMWGWPTVSLFHTQSTWAIVLVTFQRFVAVCFPHKLVVLCSTRKTRIYAITAFMLVNLFQLPVFLDAYLVKKWDATKNKTVLVRVYTDLGKSDVYQTTYKTTLSYIFLYFAPLLLLAIFTTFLIRSLRRSAQMRKEAASTSAENNAEYDSVTLMLVMTVVIYLLTQPWEPIRRILELAYDGQQGCGHVYFYFTPLANVLGAVNSACNFYVFCLFSKRVRSLAYKVMCGGLYCKTLETQREAWDRSNASLHSQWNRSNTALHSPCNRSIATINSTLHLNDIQGATQTESFE